ncbi:hypothetical protein [Arthrobacter sp. NPDC056493]|uniref:hypothetical protein n=1 Tax=Arthrobacter sp. NPDC056493 TaxID=3345839 RepID=UPI00366A9199
MNTSLALARAVADAVLYEGYLLYPYRASSQKNRARWQFGILGPPGAAADGSGEEPSMSADCLLAPGALTGLEIHFRFLQLQTRTAEKANDGGGFSPVDSLAVGGANWLSWDEAVEQEKVFGPFSVSQLRAGRVVPLDVPAGLDVEELKDGAGRPAGRLVRRRRALRGELRLNAAEDSGGLLRLSVTAANTAEPIPAATVPAGPLPAGNRQGAIAVSFIGAHLLLSVRDGDFVSLLDPPGWAQRAAGLCSQHRCWPVLAGPEGQTDVLLISPIILYDHPAVAPESSVALYDSTEIDEILTLRVLTLTDEEKAEARATDPRAAAVIDRCEAMSPEDLQHLHGALRSPHAFAADPDGVWTTAGQDIPWWNPEAEASVRPDQDAVVINGVAVARGSRVRVHPKRRADAQDLFFGGQTGRVTSVHFDVDGSTHVGLVLEQDPAADLHEGYGRSFYYAPDELEPLEGKETPQ